jgi:cysteine desulfurase/selenocysteine lyase
MDISKHIEEIRAEFPILSYLMYMNSAAHGPALARVQRKAMDWWDFYTYENSIVKAPDAKGEVAKALSVDRSDITWINRVSQAVNTISGMIKLERGENLVITDLGYPAGSYPFLPWREKGVEIRSVRHREGIITTEDFEASIDDKTRILSLSHVEWTSGLLHDVKSVTQIAHDHGALVVDDGYQSQGNTLVEPEKDGVDFYIFGSQKWMCCPPMAGVLYVKRAIADKFEPTYRCYDQVEEAFRDGQPWEKPDHNNIASWDHPLYSGAEKFNQGLLSADAIWGFYAALEYYNQVSLTNIERKNKELAGKLLEGLREFKVKVNTPEDPKRRTGLVTFNTGRHEENRRLYNALAKEGIIVALRYAAGIGGIRVSCHFFNTEDEIDALLGVMKKVLK